MAIIGNKVVEKDLRDYLQQSGYWGRSAEFSNLNLVAVQRPGWVQVFSFEVRAKTQTGEWKELVGACRDDERFSDFDVFLTDDIAQRTAQVTEWSKGLISQARGEGHWVKTLLLVVFVLAMSLVAVGVLTQNLRG